MLNSFRLHLNKKKIYQSTVTPKNNLKVVETKLIETIRYILFSSPGPMGDVRYCHHLPGVRPRRQWLHRP